ncbi:MAG: HAMP domain-containing histidine kinase [Chloroflexi bacterium]|jgi:signal transduction histidine kinase|nr:HAMP domain-containing histidine kinase [Chloroflexota bacterium]
MPQQTAATAKTRARQRFFWAAHPARALVEAWLLGLLIVLLLFLQADYVPRSVLGNGLLFLCGTCGMWVVLRTRLPKGGRKKRALWELAVGVAVSVMMTAGLTITVRLLGWDKVWLGTSLVGIPAHVLLLSATGPGYVFARVGVRVWLFWDRLRRQRMVWAMTHAHLVIVASVALLGMFASLLASSYSQIETPVQPEALRLLISVTEELLHFVFPAFSVLVVLTGFTLLILLPPSALFSFLVARKTTRRLETLAKTVRALRQGDYASRVEVVGEDEVGQLQSDFNAMADDLERTLHALETQRDTVSRLLQSRRELMASVSHELRTPVATVSAILESALQRWEQTPPDALRHELEVMAGEVLRLQRLIDDLLTLSQAEVDKLALDCQPTDVAPVVQRMVEAAAPLAWNAGRVEVVSEIAPDLPRACVDQGRLEQVIANLLRNAIRHTPPGGIVVAAATADADAVILQVRDTGEGIAPEDLPHIWDRFYRGEPDRARESAIRDGGGAGLGLALVKELSEMMGGSVSVESRKGQGSCFTVRLPHA